MKSKIGHWYYYALPDVVGKIVNKEDYNPCLLLSVEKDEDNDMATHWLQLPSPIPGSHVQYIVIKMNILNKLFGAENLKEISWLQYVNQKKFSYKRK